MDDATERVTAPSAETALLCGHHQSGDECDWRCTVCPSHYAVPVVGELRCLLVAPHPRYRHYTADPEFPDRFWTWTADDPRCRPGESGG